MDPSYSKRLLIATLKAMTFEFPDIPRRLSETLKVYHKKFNKDSN